MSARLVMLFEPGTVIDARKGCLSGTISISSGITGVTVIERLKAKGKRLKFFLLCAGFFFINTEKQ
jgi:hypothetical protein